jgi:hypothetical protein
MAATEDAAAQARKAQAAFTPNPPHLDGVADMSALVHLEEGNVLQNLRTRFARGEIYTSISKILVAVNPYQWLPIYGKETSQQYRGSSRFERASKLPPHVFSVAEAAFQAMTLTGTNQSMIVCGESGSGKTESAKKLLGYLAESSKRAASVSSNIEEQVVQANPILEAFGNARTVLNNNSSRFGKFTKLLFAQGAAPGPQQRPNYTISGSYIETYLLEKSRVVHQDQGERNFHVFYMLCSEAAASHVQRLRLQLSSADKHRLLNQGVTYIEGRPDSEAFVELVGAMDTLKFSKKEQDEVFRTLAALVHLGGIDFAPNERDDADSVVIAPQSAPAVATVASLLGCDSRALGMRLTTRSIHVQEQVLHKPLSMETSALNRNSICKEIYEGLFLWIVRRINRELFREPRPEAAAPSLKWIGILDVFGFESFENNSFEQFCINFCNERLQQYFNTDVIRAEQEEYMREAIFWRAIEVPDNQDVIDLIQGKNGIIPMLDSACLMPKGTDEIFTQSVFQFHKSNPRIKQARAMRVRESVPGRRGSLVPINGFAITHYAGIVVYNAAEFLVKNAENVHPDTRALLGTSTVDLVRELLVLDEFDPKIGGGGGPAAATGAGIVAAPPVPEPPSHRRRASAYVIGTADGSSESGGMAAATAATAASGQVPPLLRSASAVGRDRAGSVMARGGAPSSRFQSLAGNFARQLQLLMLTLQTTTPYFVRCINPNASKQKLLFDDEYVRPQLRCGGLIEALRILKLGFPNRVAYAEIVGRYGSILKPQPVNLNQRDFCEAVLWAFDVDRKDYQIGLTKVFFRPGKQEVLDRVLRSGSGDISPPLLAKIKKFLIKKRIIRWRGTARAAVRVLKQLRALQMLARFQLAAAAACKIHSALVKPFRAVRTRNSAQVIQAFARTYLRRKRSARTVHAATRIQRFYRHNRPARRLRKEMRERVQRRLSSLSEQELHLRQQLAGIVGLLAREVRAWMENVLKLRIMGEFFAALSDGVLLCEAALRIDSSVKIVYHKNAKPGTFYARENISNFLVVCKERFGIAQVELFLPNDLINRENVKAVVNCLLALSRVGYKKGVDPPPSVRYELERGFNIADIISKVEEEEAAQGVIKPATHARRRSSVTGPNVFAAAVQRQKQHAPAADEQKGRSVLEQYLEPLAAGAPPVASAATGNGVGGAVAPADGGSPTAALTATAAVLKLASISSVLRAQDEFKDVKDPEAAVKELLRQWRELKAGAGEKPAQRSAEEQEGLVEAARAASEAHEKALAEVKRLREENRRRLLGGAQTRWIDANHMFFFMTALSCKLTSKAPGRNLPTSLLYQRAMSAKVPFQYYKDWIKQEISKPLSKADLVAITNAKMKSKASQAAAAASLPPPSAAALAAAAAVDANDRASPTSQQGPDAQ